MLLPIFMAATKLLTLADALDTARAHQPTVVQARANSIAALARADESASGLIPNLSATASYARRTSNFAPQLSTVQGAQSAKGVSSTDTYNYFSLGLTFNQLIYDSQVTIDRYRSTKVTAESVEATERATRLGVDQQVRAAFFAARAEKDLVAVAKATLDNQNLHLDQTEGFVRVGTHPEIDLLTSKTSRANAKVAYITAQNNYETGKATLNQAMGVEQGTDYDVSDDTLPPVEGETLSTDELMPEAVAARPDLVSLQLQVKAQRLLLRSYKGNYGPQLSAQSSLTDAGVDIHNLVWNWSVSVVGQWDLFSGGVLIPFSVREQTANLLSLEAQVDAERLQVRMDVESARLAVRADKEALVASEEAKESATGQLQLAEGRYKAGSGSAVELNDAQVALTNAAGQRVQAEYNLAAARALLVKALGRK